MRLSLCTLVFEAVAQNCKTTSDCPRSAFGTCSKDGKCSPCKKNNDCVEMTRGFSRQCYSGEPRALCAADPKKLGLFFCDKATGKCQGILGDDDITGYGNHPENAFFGTSNDHAIQHCLATNPLKPNERPSVRTVSNEIHDWKGLVTQPIAANRVANSLAVFFGQFLDHDITLFGEIGGETTGQMPEDEDSLDTIFIPRNSLKNGKPTEAVTAYIDGSSIYGSDPFRLDSLRAKPLEVCGKLNLDVCEPDCAISKDGARCVAKLTCEEKFKKDKICDKNLCYILDGKCIPIPGFFVNH